MVKIIRACTVSDSFCFVEGLLPSLTKTYQVALTRIKQTQGAKTVTLLQVI